jgi:hemerythrin-like metal-binding protein
MMQQRLEWSDAFSVLHPTLDSEHRAIIETINKIIEVLQRGSDIKGLRSLLCSLKKEAATHFAHEDAILRGIIAFTSSARTGQKFLAAVSQAVVEEHLAGHAQAIDVLDGMIRDTLRDDQDLPGAIDEKLAHWFVGHAVKHDAHLKTLFQVVRSDCPELLGKVA